MRLFISIDFPENILEEVRSWIQEVKGWRKVGYNQMHLTLVFLGECSEADKEKIHKVLSQIVFKPFSVIISGLGFFPNESSPRVIWAGVQPNDDLIRLQKQVFDRLENYIKSKESHSFVPHITLARKKSRKGNASVLKPKTEQKTTDLEVNVQAFHLKESILKPSGSEHHILHTYRVGSIKKEKG